MLRHLKSAINKKQLKLLISRSFLSDAYICKDAWNARLSTPLLEKVNLDNLYYELEQRFQQSGKASPIDIDIFANRVTDETHTEELADLLHKLRLSEETTKTLESTGHAFIRNCLESGQIEQLLTVLDDRLNYGVFLDSFTANLVLNHLLKAKDFVSATRVATLLMLQEDFNNSIGRYLSLYACINYLKSPQPLHVEVEKPAEAPVAKGAKKKDIIKVRVKFLRNEYFDDHFDLKSSNHLVGKTLMMIGQDTSGAVGRSVSLMGLALYEKYKEAIDFIKKQQGADKSFHKEALDKIVELCKDAPTENEHLEAFNNLIAELQAHQISESLERAVEEQIAKTIQVQETIDIETQKKTYEQWLVLRQDKLQEELERLQRVQRLKEIENLADKMQTEEQKLWFFENEDNIELEIEKKKVVYPKRWFGKKKNPRVVDEAYVPPEIRPNRNN